MDESHNLRLVQIISILMFTKTAFSQSSQWIQANGCQNVTYRGTVFNLANNSPATCFKVCGNTTEIVALRFMECACDPDTYTTTGFDRIIAKPCTESTNTNCGCQIKNTHLWSLYKINENAFVDIVNNLKNDPSEDRRCISAQRVDNTIKYEFEECTNTHSTLCYSVLTRERDTSQPHSWQNQVCDNPFQKPVNRSEMYSQNLNINTKLWTDVFIEKAQDPKILSIIYHASFTLDSSTASLLSPITPTELSESLQERSLFNSQSSTSARLEFSQTSEPTLLNTEKTVNYNIDITSSLSESKLVVMLPRNVSLSDQESSSGTLAISSQQTSVTHSQTISPSYITVSEQLFHTSKLSLTNINQQVMSTTPYLTVEQYTKPPLTEVPFTLSSESVAPSVIKPTHMQGSSSIELMPRLQEQTPKPESLLGTFSDIKPYVIVIMTAVICGMIGVVTALLLINRTLVTSQKEMARMNDILSRKLLEDRRMDTRDEVQVTGVADEIGAGRMRMRIWESRPNEYTRNEHNVNDYEGRQQSNVGNWDNEMATRTNDFPPFSFSTRSDLRRYASHYSRPFGPMPSSD